MFRKHSLTPSEQSSTAYRTEQRVLYFINRLVPHIFPEVCVPLYRAIDSPGVRPYLKKDMQHMVHRLAARLVTCLRELSYDQRLVRLSLQTLTVRCPRDDLITAFDVFRGRLDVPSKQLFGPPSRSVLRGSLSK